MAQRRISYLMAHIEASDALQSIAKLNGTKRHYIEIANMKNLNTTLVNSILANHADALKLIESVVDATQGNKIAGMALFSTASYTDRVFDSGSRNARINAMTQRAKHFTWQALIEAVRSTDDKVASYNAFSFASGTYYNYDVREAMQSALYLKDAYKGDSAGYAGRKDIASPTLDNLEKVVTMLRGDDVLDGHHVWSFLNKCGASYKVDVTEFKKRMTFRGTADTYGSEWRDAFANIYRIFCERTAKEWNWDSLCAEVRNHQFDFNNGSTFAAFKDCFTAEKNANGNSTIIFTPLAVDVLNCVVPVSYKETYDHVKAIADSII